MTPPDGAAAAEVAAVTSKPARPQFAWDDPLLLDDQLTEDERMVRDAARDYCQDRLMSRVQQAFRNETFDREIMTELGSLVIGRDSCRAVWWSRREPRLLRLVAREVERVDSGYRSAMSVQSSLVMYPIEAYGSEEQKMKYLPKFARASGLHASV